MIIGLVSDFLLECKSKRSFGLLIHQAGTFDVKVVSMLLKLMFADSRIGKILTHPGVTLPPCRGLWGTLHIWGRY